LTGKCLLDNYSFWLAWIFFVLGEAAQAREFEADRLGMVLAAKAGFDPSAAAEIWGKLDSAKDRLLLGYSSLISFPRDFD
jgi:Zn-dependent protease with chaperone function